MSDGVRLTSEQLDKLVAEGAITSEQRDALVREKRSGFSLATIGYYFGGFMVFLTYFAASAPVFIAGSAGPLAWGLLTMAATGGPGLYLWRQTSARLAGQALLLVALSLVPYLVFTMFYMAGLLEGGETYEQFINDVQPSFLTAMVVTAAILVAALLWVRAPLPTVVLAAIVFLLILDLAAWVGVRAGSSGYTEGIVITVLAVPFGFGTLWLERHARENYAFWLGLAALASISTGLETIGGAAAYDTRSTAAPIVTGMLAASSWIVVGIYTQVFTKRGTENVFYAVGAVFVVIGVGVPCFMYGSHAVNVFYLFANLTLISLGVQMQRRVLAWGGALGAYVYLYAEAQHLFGNQAHMFMTLVGVLTIAAALLYEGRGRTDARQRT